MKRFFLFFSIAICFILSFTGSSLFALGESTQNSADVVNSYGKFPISFVENQGQMDEQIRFRIQGPQGAAIFTKDAVVFNLKQHTGDQINSSFFSVPSKAKSQKVSHQMDKILIKPGETEEWTNLRVSFVDSDPAMQPEGWGEQPGKVNYFVGKDPVRWKSNIQTYSGVIYRNVWPGIDVIYRGDGKCLKYDIRAAAGSDFSQIKLQYEGAESLSLTDTGDLCVCTKTNRFTEAKPGVYQEKDGKQIPLPGGFTLHGNYVGFDLTGADPSLPLVIDPQSDLVWSTLLGGSSYDDAYIIAVDSSGCAYIAGWTYSSDYPTTPGVFQTNPNGDHDTFVTKLDPTGSRLIYSTLLGGNGEEHAGGMAVDSSGCAYVFGETYSSDYPTTPGVFQTSLNAGHDDFVSKLDPTGSKLIYSTHLGGNGDISAGGIAIDSSGNAYVTGRAELNFPTTPMAFQANSKGKCDNFVAKLNSTGSKLLYSTFLGGSNYEETYGIAVDSFGCASVTGLTYSSDYPTTSGAFQPSYNGGNSDSFVSKLDPTGSILVYSTFLGGSNEDDGYGIAIDPSGCAYVVGDTSSSNYPTTPGAFQTSFNGKRDAFVSKLDPNGSKLLYSTFLSGSDYDFATGIAVDSAGCAYMAGDTSSSNYPTTPGAFQTSLIGSTDAFVTKLDPTGSKLLYSTLLGGEDYAGGMAVDSSGCAYVTGQITSTNFPFTPGAFQTSIQGYSDAFVAKICPVFVTSYQSPSGFIHANWNLVSLPTDPISTDVATVFAGIDVANSSFQYWNNTANPCTFQGYGNAFGWTGPVVRGIPYWFLQTASTSDTVISYQGTEPITDFIMAIPAHTSAPYWIAIGTPFPSAVSADNIQFKDTTLRGDTWLNWSDAYSSANSALRVVDSSMQGWDNSQGTFVRMAPTTFAMTSDKTQFDPWWGYWMLVMDKNEFQIKIPKP